MRDERTPSNPDAPSADLVLAAIDRAIRQFPRPVSDISAGEIALHLAINRRSGVWRQARRRLKELEQTSDVRQGRRNGVTVWALTPAGRQRLARAVATSSGPVLPESPQHRRWQDARRLAQQEQQRYRAELTDALSDATRTLEDDGADSAAWFALAARLQAAAERVGAVTFCLTEWPEPDDAGPDTSDGPRLLRRARFGNGRISGA
jgi:hypothetical protein